MFNTTVPDDDIRVLYLGSNPLGDLMLEDEAKAIGAALDAHAGGTLPYAWRADSTIDDFFDALDRFGNLQILHLGGHGNKVEGLGMVDDTGRLVFVSGARLRRALARNRSIGLIVLSACSTLDHADELAKSIDVAIATSNAIDDAALISFSARLYKEIALGKDLAAAYERAAAYAGTLFDAEADLLRLRHREHIEPRWVPIHRGLPRPEVVSVLDRHQNALTRARARPSAQEIILHGGVSEADAVVPDGESTVRQPVVFRPGDGGWQRAWPIDPKAWETRLFDLLVAAKIAQDMHADDGWAIIHVVARMPLSFFAVLGSKLEHHGRELPVYWMHTTLPDSTDKVWQPWGPGWQAIRPTPDTTPVLRGLQAGGANPNVRHVGVSISITHPINDTDARPLVIAAARRPGEAILREITLRDPAHGITDATVDQAARELRDFFETLPRVHPNLDAVHVFYAGPGALLARAMTKAHIGRGDVLMYEYFAGHGYRRILNVSKALLAIDASAS